MGFLFHLFGDKPTHPSSSFNIVKLQPITVFRYVNTFSLTQLSIISGIGSCSLSHSGRMGQSDMHLRRTPIKVGELEAD
ncbi:hypothetical protein AMATHDRAFT_61949 [Amanita thiersii Skay4041]|uniref:Uncharacterized protein n=1 Tax=Amanita thiersii Skay4041 TaxID=703135 RepID=A0A2A9NQR9_9AGAR|nr:hypothetical protein AMATHDRAFT_61949 [Amanita thiersii Skay4041]